MLENIVQMHNYYLYYTCKCKIVNIDFAIAQIFVDKCTIAVVSLGYREYRSDSAARLRMKNTGGMDMDFGDRLKQLMAEKKMSVTRLAELSGVNRNTLYSYIRRNTKKPDPSVLAKIAPVLETSVVALLGVQADAPAARVVKMRSSSADGYRIQRSKRRESSTESPDLSVDELWGIRETLRRSPEMRTLFSLSSKATPEQLRQAIKIIEALRGDESEY